MSEVMLTTIDNPFNPFTNYDSWLQYDLEKGNNCNSVLALHVDTLSDLPDETVDEEIESAIDAICVSDFPLFNKDGKLIHFIKVTNSKKD